MNDIDIFNFILIISLISLCYLFYFFRKGIVSFVKRICESVNRRYNVHNLSEPNEYCVFAYWLKFFQFFVWFIFMLSGIVILFWMVFKNPLLPVFFQTFTITKSLKTINELSTIQNYFAKDFSALILLVGVFAGYCYFFNYLRSAGWKINKLSGGEGKWSSFFIYLFFLCIFIAIVFIGGSIFHYYGDLDSNKIFELFILTIILTITFLNVWFFKKIFPNQNLTFEKTESVVSFLKQEDYETKFNLICLIIFLITLELAGIGYIFGFNPLTIVCLDIFLLYTIWVLGILYQVPQKPSTVRLKIGRSISHVYILDIDDDFISYLTRDDHIDKITISSVFKVEKSNESSLFRSNQIINDYQNSDKKCYYLSKISEGTIIFACSVSIFIGIFLMLIQAFFQFLQFKELFNLGIIVISILLFCVLVFLSMIIVITFKEINKNSSDLI
jgi:hypothetical protein